MKIKLDENLGRSAQRLLQADGHDVHRVADEGLSGCPDPQLFEHVTTEGRFFITLDKDFSDVRQFPPGSHPGVLVLRLPKPGPNAIANLLRRILAEGPLERLSGALASADLAKTRVRRSDTGQA